MNHPPAQIEGFAVLEYGFLSEPSLPVGYIAPSTGRTPLEPMQGFAICTAKGVDGFYLLACTSNWRYMTYSFSELRSNAKDQVLVEFGTRIELWHPASPQA